MKVLGENRLMLDENGDTSMRKNLSEEMIINDDISLGKDAEDQVKEDEKALNDHEKEVNKDLADKVKDVEEINEFEAEPIEIHNGEDKKLKIKGLTEKLILEEPSDILTEANDIDDILFELRDQCVRDVHNELHSYLKHCEYANIDYPYNTKEAAIDALESICEEAIYHMDDILDNSGMLTEEVLDEKIPQDLAKAYKRAGYQGRSGSNTDLQNAEYREVTPEEGYKLYKQDPKQVRLLLGDQLVDFRDDGRPSDSHRDQYVAPQYQFTNRNGKVVRDTMYIPPKYMFSVADKIYVTNEHTPEGQKDQDLLNKRRENPESPKSSVVNNLKNRGIGNDGWSDSIRGDRDYMRAAQMGSSNNGYSYKVSRMNRLKKDIANYRKELSRDNLSDGDRDWYKRQLDDAQKSLRVYQNEMDDAKARLRYADSEIALQKPFERYSDLKRNLSSLQRNVDRAEHNLEDVKANGSSASRENRERLADLQSRLKELRKKIAEVELDLEGTDEEDARAVAEAEARYNAAMGQLGDAQAEINALLRRN